MPLLVTMRGSMFAPLISGAQGSSTNSTRLSLFCFFLVFLSGTPLRLKLLSLSVLCSLCLCVFRSEMVKNTLWQRSQDSFWFWWILRWEERVDLTEKAREQCGHWYGFSWKNYNQLQWGHRYSFSWTSLNKPIVGTNLRSMNDAINQ